MFQILLQLKSIFAELGKTNIVFDNESYFENMILEAEGVKNQISSLLQQDKVSVTAIRDILAKVEATPVDLQIYVDPLKKKMISAQKWLDRARKCMPKRQTTRSAIPSSKMDLSAVRDLVINAPVEDGSEMQEMEDLLEYAEDWIKKVHNVIETSADVTIEILKELLEEGREMPVFMEQTKYLAAEIEAREWIDEAKEKFNSRATLEVLEELKSKVR